MSEVLRVGMGVSWRNNASIRVGRVVSVVPAGEKPLDFLPRGSRLIGTNTPKQVEGYLISAGRLVYFPDPSKLKIVADPRFRNERMRG